MRRTESTWPIVVGIDGTEEADQAAQYAAEFAGVMGRPLRLLHAYRRWQALSPVVPPAGPKAARAAVAAVTYSPYAWAVSDELASAAGERVLHETAADLQRVHPGLDVETVLVAGSPPEALTVASANAFAVVVARSRNHLAHVVATGSTTSAVAAHSRSPVVVFPRGCATDFTCQQVVLGFEGHPAETEAIEFAFQVATHAGVPLRIVHSMRQLEPTHLGIPRLVHTAAALSQTDKRAIAESVSCWSAGFPGTNTTTVFSSAPPIDALLGALEPHSMLVISSRGSGGLRGLLLGSTARSMMTHAPCPVAVVHVAREPRHAAARHSSVETELAEEHLV